MPNNFNYFLGVPADKSLPEFICDDPLERVMTRVSKITLSDSRDLDATLKEKSRLVEFSEAFDYSTAGRTASYLSYFKSMNNIFDLEFFTNKLASSAKCIANLEKMVLSGVPFWEEGDEALFGDMDDDEEESEEEKAPVQQKGPPGKNRGKKGNDDKFDDDGHKPLKNVLAGKVADKIA